MKAHDVRRLAACCHCGEIGFDLPLVSCHVDETGRKRSKTHAHAGCIVAKEGLPALLSLPASELTKAPLGEVGVEAMLKVIKVSELRKEWQEAGDGYFDHALECETCNLTLRRSPASRSPSNVTEDPEEMCDEGLERWNEFQGSERRLEAEGVMVRAKRRRRAK